MPGTAFRSCTMNKRTIHNILCPVDFSEASQTALRYAARLATCRDADIGAIRLPEGPFP